MKYEEGISLHVKKSTHCGDEMCSACVVAVNSTLNDMVQINLHMRDLSEFDAVREVFLEYFDKDRFPARMILTGDFMDSECLYMIDGITYRPQYVKQAFSSYE